jgi:hypothetical protein
MYSASLPTPPSSEEVNADRNHSPTKYRPGWDPTTPRWCAGVPSRSKTGRSIQVKSGRNPVHQSTVATSMTRPFSSIGEPS